MLLLGLLVFGLFCGWVAQMILGQGSRPDLRALIAGIAGSFVGGLIGSLIAGDGLRLKLSGFLGSICGAVIVLAIWIAIDKRSAGSSSENAASKSS
jgi:uncharacterized membrane protein YeaQ/YmgE (transglycosylase-associated protein family)